MLKKPQRLYADLLKNVDARVRRPSFSSLFPPQCDGGAQREGIDGKAGLGGGVGDGVGGGVGGGVGTASNGGGGGSSSARGEGGGGVATNRTLWFVGNSVSRIHFFAALAMLSGEREQKSISDQIDLCGRGGEWRGRRPGQGVSCLGPCSCSATVPGGGRLAFVWQQRTFDRVIGPALLGRVGSIPIRAGDVVFLNAGLDNVVDMAKRSYTKKAGSCARLFPASRAAAPLGVGNKSRTSMGAGSGDSGGGGDGGGGDGGGGAGGGGAGGGDGGGDGGGGDGGGVARGVSVSHRNRTSDARAGTSPRRAEGAARFCTQEVRRRWNASVETDAEGLARAVSAARSAGRRVIWRTSSPVCFEPDFLTNWGLRTREVNAMLDYSDAHVTAAMRSKGVPIVNLAALDRGILCAQSLASSRPVARAVARATEDLTRSHGGVALYTAIHAEDEAALTACRCKGYGMDSTHLHPSPETAAAQVSAMLHTLTRCSD